jgi:AraC-like DNA-binding protein
MNRRIRDIHMENHQNLGRFCRLQPDEKSDQVKIVYHLSAAGFSGKEDSVRVLEMGWSQCPPAYRFGPAVREAYLLHFIHGGEGDFHGKEGTRRLGKGEGFLITPGERVCYEADQVHPWRYGWVAFTGKEAHSLLQSSGLSRAERYFLFDPERTDELTQDHLCALEGWTSGRGAMLTSWFFRMLASIREMKSVRAEQAQGSQKQQYTQEALLFVERNHHRQIHLADIARHVRIHPRHLSVVFKEMTGDSPYAHLQRVRMEHACVLLRNLHVSVGDVARSVGYPDPLHFSRVFKKEIGMTPLAWKRGES